MSILDSYPLSFIILTTYHGSTKEWPASWVGWAGTNFNPCIIIGDVSIQNPILI
jgi:hypothetical protein